MFEITLIVNGSADTYNFYTLQQAQAWLETCTIAYDKATMVIQFDNNLKGE